MMHIEDMPELGKGDGQECDRHCRTLIQPKPETTQSKRAERHCG
jgi:hypothetical protein